MSKTRQPKFHYWRSTDNNQWYFHLRTGNGEIVAQSEGYKTRQSCLRGISACRAAMTTATVVRDDKEQNVTHYSVLRTTFGHALNIISTKKPKTKK